VYLKETVTRVAGTAKTGIRGYFRKLFRALPFIFTVLAILCVVISAFQIVFLKESQFDQYAAERWAADSKQSFRQVSVIGRGQLQSSGSAALFIDSGVSLNKQIITELRNTLSGIVSTAASEKKDKKTNDKIPSSGRAWVDAYYAEAEATIRSVIDGTETGKSAEAQITGISGYYYLFHPRQILSGSFLSEIPVDGQTVVLNEQLAWLLFQSNDIQDQTVIIGAREYTIIGVVREPSEKTDITAGFDVPRAYIYFDELALMNRPEVDPSGLSGNKEGDFEFSQESSSDFSDEGQVEPGDLSILCYEAVLPDPIDGIALNDLKSALTSYNPGEENFYFVNHTDRFGLLRIADGVMSAGKDVPSRSMFTFPSGELSAQITEQYLTIAWSVLFAGVFFLIISLLASVLTVRKNLSQRDLAGSENEKTTDESSEKIERDVSISSIRRV